MRRLVLPTKKHLDALDQSGRVERFGPVRRQHAQPLGVRRAIHHLPLHEAEVCGSTAINRGHAACLGGAVHFSALERCFAKFVGGVPRSPSTAVAGSSQPWGEGVGWGVRDRDLR